MHPSPTQIGATAVDDNILHLPAKDSSKPPVVKASAVQDGPKREMLSISQSGSNACARKARWWPRELLSCACTAAGRSMPSDWRPGFSRSPELRGRSGGGAVSGFSETRLVVADRFLFRCRRGGPKHPIRSRAHLHGKDT